MGQRWRTGESHGDELRCGDPEFRALLDGLLVVLGAAEVELAVIAGAYPLEATALQTIARCEAYLRASRVALTIARSSARGAPAPGFSRRFDA